MTREDIVRMAREAGAMFDHMTWVERDLAPVFERFAALVAEHERGAYAKACGAVQCEPQEAVTEDGWCEWVCPQPQGYLMQCCDCGLIHEVESRVAKYEPRPSEVFEVVDDPDLQVQWRMKRRDDLSPQHNNG